MDWTIWNETCGVGVVRRCEEWPGVAVKADVTSSVGVPSSKWKSKAFGNALISDPIGDV